MNNSILENNKETYENSYSKEECFLKYPADWIIRFHNIYMKNNLPTGRILDYGCGSGNNSIFFIKNGYEVFGTETANASIPLFKKNLASNNLDANLSDNISIISPDAVKLPYEDNSFDFIFSNQVLYYLSSKEQIQSVCKELERILKPNGVVFFTMMGKKNHFIKKAKLIEKNIYEVNFDNPKDRLYGKKEQIYLIKNKKEMVDLFSNFDCLNTGYFEQSMFDMKSNFHWIFVGKKYE